MTLVLASSSPRRRELLSTLVAHFDIRSSDIDETPHRGESPVDYVRRIATQKAFEHVSTDSVNLGEDTIVVLEGQIIGKPSDVDEARIKSIHCWSNDQHLTNLKPPCLLDATSIGWAAKHYGQDLIFLVNLLHLISIKETKILVKEMS